jgi:hypothetical protein
MRNEPNFQKSQMFITLIPTTNYSEKYKLDTWSKRTQMPLGMAYATKPILPARVAGKIALPVRRSFSEDGSAVEGPIVSTIYFWLFNFSVFPYNRAIGLI